MRSEHQIKALVFFQRPRTIEPVPFVSFNCKTSYISSISIFVHHTYVFNFFFFIDHFKRVILIYKKKAALSKDIHWEIFWWQNEISKASKCCSKTKLRCDKLSCDLQTSIILNSQMKWCTAKAAWCLKVYQMRLLNLAWWSSIGSYLICPNYWNKHEGSETTKEKCKFTFTKSSFSVCFESVVISIHWWWRK